MAGGFAVIDVETTGLSADRHDRVVEVAVVRLDAGGQPEGEWCTLVNPQRDMGPQHIHRISAAQARLAPTFADIAGDLAAQLAGRVLVAHNLPFDARFVQAEYARLGSVAELAVAPGLCTMRLATELLDSPSRKLAACCAVAGVPLTNAHSALYDARAAAGLLRYFLRDNGSTWQHLVDQALVWPWPVLPEPCGRRLLRGHTPRAPIHFLARLVDRLPRVTEPPNADAYLAVLDNALLDRHVSDTEQDALVDTATALGLDREQVLGLHWNYLLGLARAAWADEVVTAAERADLVLVARLLGLAEQDVELALEQTLGQGDAHERFRLLPGDQVVFTGQTSVRPREQWEQVARERGLRVHGGVTKRTRLVIAADPDSASGKAAKARTYGIPIVTEQAFERLLTDLPSGPSR
ncbi:exonuclease, RNase T and DNA polymerase III [Kutzneria albida DSM 43870]|uniref:Exonuclease, RNase T and DNA polymerase III n=2 Tax=Kutzneria TaxID=43356 RepID=W5W4U4_9PSEU|nr:exonuclease, RNase T and DNA polymerase III [Kutzneria albida DSM 43870]